MTTTETQLLDTIQALQAENTALSESFGALGLERDELREAIKVAQEDMTVLSMDYANADAECQALKAKLEQIESQEPLFYYRPTCNGEMHEGPHHAKSVGGRMERELKPNEWFGLYALPPVNAELGSVTSVNMRLQTEVEQWKVDFNEIKMEHDALKADAERYRWLRTANPDEGPAVMESRMNDWGKWVNVVLHKDNLDAAIDAAKGNV